MSGSSTRPGIRRLDGLIVMLTGPGEKPFLRYEVDGQLGILRILATYVPPQLRGRGFAEALVEEAIKLAEERGLKVEPFCSYALHYFIKHRDRRGALVDWLRNKSDDELLVLLDYVRAMESDSKARLSTF